ncbi:MAG: hypothetical protein KDA93_13410 [Planctomycetaceae bacterium]|nr:hypothetical protein [Planctomycetaceae bacterium]
MNRFDRDMSRLTATIFGVFLFLTSTLSSTGCATGRQGWQAIDPAPIQGSAPSGGSQPTLAPQQQPSESGPVILPRDSFRRPPGSQQADTGQRRMFGFGLPPRITPRNVPSPLASRANSPLIRHTPPPAELSGDIEIVPNAHIANSTSQQNLIDIVPNEPATLDPEGVELLTAPVRGRYEELPPPPE